MRNGTVIGYYADTPAKRARICTPPGVPARGQGSSHCIGGPPEHLRAPVRGAQSGGGPEGERRGRLHGEPHLHGRCQGLGKARGGQGLSLVARARLEVDEWTGDHQGQIERANGQAPVLKRAVRGGARVVG